MMSIETVGSYFWREGASIKLFILVESEVLGFGARLFGPFILSSCMRLGAPLSGTLGSGPPCQPHMPTAASSWMLLILT